MFPAPYKAVNVSAFEYLTHTRLPAAFCLVHMLVVIMNTGVSDTVMKEKKGKRYIG